MVYKSNTSLTNKQKSELDFWRGMVAELTRDCASDSAKAAALLQVSYTKTFPRYKNSLYLQDDAFAGKRILDVGCGPHCGIIGFTDCEKHGLDPLIDEYRKLGYPLEQYGVEFQAAGSEQMPYEDNFFDVVLCVNALDHVDNLQQALREIARVLKPGGKLLGQFNFHAYATDCEPVVLDEASLNKSLAKIGLQVLKTHYQCSINNLHEDRYYYEAEKSAAVLAPKESIIQKIAQLVHVNEKSSAPANTSDEGKWKLNADPYLLFRLVPTMRCNYRCEYCFLGDEGKAEKENMFMLHSPEEWVQAMKNFQNYQVEFYGWGGEPFLLDGVYDVIRGWCAYDFVTGGNRLDTNMYFTDKIAERCPTDKVKLNCSWHTKYDTLDSIYAKVTKLNNLGMVGMVNFVASLSNMEVLTHEYKMTLDDLVAKFAEIDVFLNVAADFGIVHNKNLQSRDIDMYKRMILRYVSMEEWQQQRGEKSACTCTANKRFFTVFPNGDLKACLGDKVYGNFFDGTLDLPEFSTCTEFCPSLISYPFRIDNTFPYRQHLVEYVKRNKIHRQEVRLQESYSTVPTPGWDVILSNIKLEAKR